MSKKAKRNMAQNTKCPQCGSEISINEYYKTPRCAVCGWGMLENAVVSQPPSGFKHYIRSRTTRWKFGAVAVSIIAVLLVTPMIGVISSNLMANQALAKATSQMNGRLYASAARTLNEAPRPIFSSAKVKNMNTMVGNTIRYAQDISDVKTAKKSMVADKPEDALASLDEIEEDFPQEDEAIDLMDLAQDLELDPDLDVSVETLDDIAFTPDDPESENLAELASEADVPTETPEATVAEPASTGSNTADPLENPAETTPPEEVAEEPVAEELPDAPEPAAAANQPATAVPSSSLTPLYQLSWSNKKPNSADQDSFYTIDLNNEATPRKDKRSNFNGYGPSTVIGQVYKRKVSGNKNIVPLYRYWSATKTDHYYTTSSKFSSANKNSNYIRQQIAGYVGKWNGTACLDGTKPLYNIYNSSLSDNFYTTDVALKDGLIKNNGWKNPRVAGCIW